MDFEYLEYGETVPGVVCPECGGELVHTSVGAYCDWDSRWVPIIGKAIVVDDGTIGQDDDNGDADSYAY